MDMKYFKLFEQFIMEANQQYDFGCEVYLLIARAKSAVASRKNQEDSYNLPSL